jgi:hypothetical protein
VAPGRGNSGIGTDSRSKTWASPTAAEPMDIETSGMKYGVAASGEGQMEQNTLTRATMAGRSVA